MKYVIVTLIMSIAWTSIEAQQDADFELAMVLKGHSGWAESVCFSPDGSLLASGHWGNTIKLWRVSDGSLKRTLKGHSYNNFNSVCFSPDGLMLASAGSDDKVKLWSVSDGSLIRTLKGHSIIISSVCFSPDGSLLASASDDGTVKLWRVFDGSLEKTIMVHLAVYSICFSPDGFILASGSSDKMVKFWQVSNGSLIRTLKGHSHNIYSVCFSPDGSLVASGSDDETVKLWKVSDGNLIKTLKGHSKSVMSLCFSPDGIVLASGSSDETIRIYYSVSEIRQISSNQSSLFEKVESINIINAYEDFIRNCPKYPFTGSIISKAIRKIYALTSEADAVDGYRYFLHQYPNSPEAEQASNRLYEIMYAIAEEENSIASYNEFLNNFPKAGTVLRQKSFGNAQLLEVELVSDELGDIDIEDNKTKERLERIARTLYVEAIQAKESGDDYTFMRKYNTVLYSPFFKGTQAAFDLFRDKELARLIKGLRNEILELRYEMRAQNRAILAKLGEIQSTESANSEYLSRIQEITKAQADDWAEYVTNGSKPTSFWSPKIY